MSAYPLEAKVRKLSSDFADIYFVLGVFDSDNSMFGGKHDYYLQTDIQSGTDSNLILLLNRV